MDKDLEEMTFDEKKALAARDLAEFYRRYDATGKPRATVTQNVSAALSDVSRAPSKGSAPAVAGETWDEIVSLGGHNALEQIMLTDRPRYDRLVAAKRAKDGR